MSAHSTYDTSDGLCLRVLANSLLPALVLLCILVGYYVHTETRMAETDHIYKTRLLAQRLATLVAVQPDAFQTAQLTSWLSKQPERAEVTRIEVHDAEKNFIASFDAEPATENRNAQELRVITEPVPGKDVIPDSSGSSHDTPVGEQYFRVVGYVRISVSHQLLNTAQQKILLDGLVMLLYGFGLLGLLGYSLVMLYCRPLQEIEVRVQALLDGDFSSRNSSKAFNELWRIGSRLEGLAHQLNRLQTRRTHFSQNQELRIRGLMRSLKNKEEELTVALAQCEHEQRARLTFVTEVERELRPRLFRLAESGSSIPSVSADGGKQALDLLPVLDDLLGEWRSTPLKLEMTPHVFELASCLESLIGLLSPGLPHLSLVLSIHPETPSRLFADPTRLTQVLGRWIVQLGSLMQRGMLVVRIRPSQITGKPGLLFLVHAPIRNLPRETLQRMSFLFSSGNVVYTVDQGTRKATTMESVVKAMNGRHGITTRMWMGSCCYLYLPLGLEASHQAPSMTYPVSFYVNDPVPASRKAWVWRLEAMGVRVHVIESLENPLDPVTQPAWVLVNMPVSHYSRQDELLKDSGISMILQSGATPVVVLPYGDLEGRDYYRKQGAVCFNQPVRTSELLALLTGMEGVRRDVTVFVEADERIQIQEQGALLSNSETAPVSDEMESSEILPLETEAMSPDTLLINDYSRALLEATRNNRKLALSLMQKLLEELPAQYQGIVEALEQGNIREARDIVHKINGSASFCRLTNLRTAANTLEAGLMAALESGESLPDSTKGPLLALLDEEVDRLLSVAWAVLKQLEES